MHIIIDGVIFGLQKAGGISRVWVQILQALDESPHKVTLLLPKNANIELLALSFKKITILKRKRFKWGKRGFLRDSLYLTRLALNLRPTIWHTTYYSGFPLLFSGQKIVTFHDMIGEILGESSLYETKLKYQTLKSADSIIAISENSKKDLVSKWPELEAKTTVIQNTLGFSLQPAAPQPYFLFVGKRGGYKNFLPVVTKILNDPQFASYKIKVVGGEKECLQISERMEFLHTVPYLEVQRLMASSTALLFPSLYEGFGLPLLEAFCAEVPVLAMRSSSIPEIVGEDYPLVDPKDPNSISTTLAKLLKERQKWIDYGKNRRKLFPADKMTQTLLHYYESCAFRS